MRHRPNTVQYILVAVGVSRGLWKTLVQRGGEVVQCSPAYLPACMLAISFPQLMITATIMRSQILRILAATFFLLTTSQAINRGPTTVEPITNRVASFFHVDFGREDAGGCGQYLDKIESGYDQAIKAIASARKAINVLDKARPGTDETNLFNEWMRAAQAVQDMFGFQVPSGRSLKHGPDSPESENTNKIRRKCA